MKKVINKNMADINHDPTEYIRGIQQILISDKKGLVFLFGAGSSLAKKKGSSKSLTVPAIAKMTNDIVSKVGDIKNEYKIALDEIKLKLGENNFIKF